MKYWEMHLNSLPGEKRRVLEEARDNLLINTGRHVSLNFLNNCELDFGA